VVGSGAVSGEVHVGGVIDDAHPLTLAGGAGEIVPGDLAGLRGAFQRFVAGAGEDEQGLLDAGPGVFREDDARAFGGQSDVGVEAVAGRGGR
jgi:hypothetical protein